MASLTLFRSSSSASPATDTVNEAGGAAYALPARHALAQLASTGCLSTTFYASAETQLDQTLRFAAAVEPGFLARTAIHARERGRMKDMPALLCAALAGRDVALLERVFPRVIDDARMLRNFVQIIRSGATGRRSLGSAPRRCVRQWLESRTDEQVFRACVGTRPSLADIVRMVHPRPATPSRAALYAWLIGQPHDAAALPAIVREFEAFKAGAQSAPPDVPFQLLTALPLSEDAWAAIARRLPWQATRMNLNTLARHGVFRRGQVLHEVAERLRNPQEVRRSRVLPYQLLTAHAAAGPDVPAVVREALQDAMEVAIENIPAIPGRVHVFIDMSGSMHSPVTGHRPGATSVVRCIDVAALFAAAILRRNREAEITAFESKAVPVQLNPRDTVFTNAAKLAALPAGGTNCSAPLALLNQRRAPGDLVIYLSDNESWMDTPQHGRFGGSPTATMREWEMFRRRNAGARLVCLDLQPYAQTQAAERADILNIGGFSDTVFPLVADFARGELSPGHWVAEIEKVQL